MIARKTLPRLAAFTLVEILVAMAAFGLFATALLTAWNSINATAVNTTAYTRRQNDQMRVLDYLKRDIRRATTVEIYDGASLVTGTTTFGSELRLTIPDYYEDTREEDNALGTNTPNAAGVTAGKVTYGTALTVRYYALNGAAVRDEASALRKISDSAGAFTLSFKRETNGSIRSRVFFDQPMRGGKTRTLRRQVDCLSVPRFELQL